MQRIGVDAVSVDRIALAVRRSGPGFLAKVYTPAELTYCNGNDERLAGRWAAKEAVIKCFDGTGICFPRRRIEVLPGPNGAPRARLLGNDRGAQLEVSITHHSRLAVATAHLEIPDVGTMLPAPDAVLIPARPKDAHKGTFGTAVVLAGSLGLTGAAYLSSTAAARTGAGLVRLLVGQPRPDWSGVPLFHCRSAHRRRPRAAPGGDHHLPHPRRQMHRGHGDAGA